ncbi:MAG: hypothetical protein IT328_14265, partial [Caldilineaceae bacterium]|nr:hypothetical protein [Caldilineaceae bacterium]
MQTTHSQAHSPKWLILVVTLTLLATALFGTSQRAYAAAAVPSPQSALLKDGGGDDGGGDDHGDDIKVYARVVSRPDGTNIGSWTIGDKNYTVNEQTIISTLHGPLTINGCVEVEVAPSAPTLAKELGSEEDSKCSTLPGD